MNLIKWPFSVYIYIDMQQKGAVLCSRHAIVTTIIYTESLDDDDSDDEPLSKPDKKHYPQLERKSPSRTPRKAASVRSQRNAARKKGRSSNF